MACCWSPYANRAYARAAGPVRSADLGRSRTERLVGFRYRLETYTPAERRRHGYYVFPFLLGERLVGRVDLKADRVAAAFVIESAPAATASRLA